MSLNEEKVIIIEPSKKLFETYDEVKKEIEKLKLDLSIDLIGSLAVPMKGKNEIDILIQTNDVKIIQEALNEIGFKKGPIIKKEGFCKKKKNNIVIDLHIVPFKHHKIEIYKKITKILKENKNLKESFELLKISLNGKSVEEYKKAKNEFMKENNLI